MSEHNVHVADLSNGLKLIGETRPNAMSVSLGFFVRTGSRDEWPEVAGVSHFLEHMMFKGTAKRSAADVNNEFGNIGAQANAFTSDENTVYYATVVPEYFRELVDLMSDMLRPALDEDEFKVEKKVILEEIALYQDRPGFYLYESAVRDFFGNHHLGNSVLGSTDSVGNLSREEMLEYFSKRYRAGNITLAVSGNFDWMLFEEMITERCASWYEGRASREYQPFHRSRMEQHYTKENLQQFHGLFMAPGFSAENDNRYACALLSTILGDSVGSRLYWELVDPGLAESAIMDHDTKDKAGVWMTSFSTTPENSEKVVEIVRSVLRDPLSFSDEDFERAKNKVLTRVTLEGELSFGRMMALGSEWVYRQRLRELDEEIEAFQSITVSDLRKLVEGELQNLEWSEFTLGAS
ncbi:MAG: insulinase family protein [Bdellovibrionales bacterium]|nr:insulinase family protein [Bdellovibrionales bacterium]